MLILDFNWGFQERTRRLLPDTILNQDKFLHVFHLNLYLIQVLVGQETRRATVTTQLITISVGLTATLSLPQAYSQAEH